MASKIFVSLCLIVKILYTNANVIPYQSSTRDGTALIDLKADFLAEAKRGNVDKLKVIYHKPKSQRTANDVINAQDQEGRSALHWSIINENIEAAEYIIKIGANVNTAMNKKMNKYEGETPLIAASFDGMLSIVN